MMRSAGKLFGVGAGVAAANVPSQSQCHAQPSRAVLPQRELERAGKGVLPIGSGWLVTDLDDALNHGGVLFEEAEIEDTVNLLFGLNKPKKGPDLGSDTSSETTDSADAQMMEAETSLAVSNPQTEFYRMLHTLLHDPEVQRACVDAVRRDPDFHHAMYDKAAGVTISNPLLGEAQTCTVEEINDDTSARAGEESPLQKFVNQLANNIKHAGEDLLGKACGVRDALGRFLINMGANLHSLLGHPFSSPPVDQQNIPVTERAEAEQVPGNGATRLPSYLPVLMTVAVAVLSIVLLRRAHVIKFT